MADKSGSAFARDPMAQKWWTLPMALAWALWKTPEMVDWAWYVSASTHAHSKPLTLSNVLWRFRYDEIEGNAYLEDRGGKRQEKAEDQVRSALEQLADALENQRIQGEGTTPYTQIRRVTVVDDWRRADIGSLHLNSDLPEHDTLYVRRSLAPILLGVRVLREDVVREFDAAPEVASVGGAAEKPAGLKVETEVDDRTTLKGPLLGEPLKAFIRAHQPPDGLSADALFHDLQEKAKQVGRKVDRKAVRKLHGTDIYPNVAGRGRPRNSAE